MVLLIPSSGSPIDFHDKTLHVLVKNLKYFLYEKYIKWFYIVSEEKYLALLRVLYPFTKSFVSPFADIAFTFLIAHLIQTSTYLVLFELFFLLKTNSLLSKSVFFMKLVILLLLATFARFNLKSKIYLVNLLYFGVVIYLSWL